MPAGGIPDSILDDSLMRFLVCHLCKTLWAHNFVNAKPLQVELDSEDLKDFVRVFFKIEEAHWFYLDHYCDNNPVLPKVGLREFCEIVCRHVPYLQRFVEYLDDHWKAWKQYKANIPTAGAILLDETLEYVSCLAALLCLSNPFTCLSSRDLFPPFSEGLDSDHCSLMTLEGGLFAHKRMLV